MKSAAVIIPMYNHRYLIMLRSGSDPYFPLKWNFPGGGLEEGEDPKDGAVRELVEESAIEARKDDLEKVGIYYQDGIQIHLYRLRVDSPVVRCRDGEHQEYTWVPPHSLLHYELMPGTQKILSEIKEQQ